MIRSNWSRSEVSEIYWSPLLELIFRAAGVHRQYHDATEVEVAQLLSIKTGGCSEDCAYCAQSVHNKEEVDRQALLSVPEVVDAARGAKENGATRFCMGAAWRSVKNNSDFERVLEMVREVSGLGLEVCLTLGMLSPEQAARLKEAGAHYYNHNIDTSESYYKKIVTTHTYRDRLNTLKNVREAGLHVCCGGILGLGEAHDDRIDFLHTLCSLEPHPESVPINVLVKIAGSRLKEANEPSVWDLARVIASARILMPQCAVRLSAGRMQLSAEAQAICFMAGANSIFGGEKLLTTGNCTVNQDQALFDALGLRAMCKEGNFKLDTPQADAQTVNA